MPFPITRALSFARVLLQVGIRIQPGIQVSRCPVPYTAVLHRGSNLLDCTSLSCSHAAPRPWTRPQMKIVVRYLIYVCTHLARHLSSKNIKKLTSILNSTEKHRTKKRPRNTVNFNHRENLLVMRICRLKWDMSFIEKTKPSGTREHMTEELCQLEIAKHTIAKSWERGKLRSCGFSLKIQIYYTQISISSWVAWVSGQNPRCVVQTYLIKNWTTWKPQFLALSKYHLGVPILEPFGA